jgi:TolB protein
MARYTFVFSLAIAIAACSSPGRDPGDDDVPGDDTPDPDATVIIDPTAPADAPDQFGNADPGGVAPMSVYPSTGTLIPPNMNTIEVQFRPGAGNDLFELDVQAGALHLLVYLGCTPLADGCVYEPPQQVWDLIAMSARGGEPAAWKLRGLDRETNLVGTSESRTLQFATEDLAGGIYYWAAQAGAIMRYEFGRRGQTAERFLDTLQAGALQCVGCHALARDGTMIAVGLEAPLPATLATFTVETRDEQWRAGGSFPPSPGGANFYTFSPDNQWLLSSEGNNLTVREAVTGANMQMVVASGTMPDWSAAGDKVVFSRPGSTIPGPGNPGVDRGTLVTIDPSTWSGEQVLVAGGTVNNYYPSFSPDGQWVLYNQCNGSTNSFDAPDARVMVVPSSGGAPLALSMASPTGGDSWPKWAPYVNTYQNGSVMWLTFSSRRPYGLRADGTSQIWMVGFDPTRAAQHLDPSFSAFWLPFQDSASGNHIAQWVESIIRQTCEDATECGAGEICEEGVCVPPPIE